MFRQRACCTRFERQFGEYHEIVGAERENRPSLMPTTTTSTTTAQSTSFSTSSKRPRGILLAVILLLQLLTPSVASSGLGPRVPLRCTICTSDNYMGLYAIDMNNQRLVTDMPFPQCQQHEEVVCDRDQDVCIMTRMKMGVRAGWWINMGCSKRALYPWLPPLRPPVVQHVNERRIDRDRIHKFKNAAFPLAHDDTDVTTTTERREAKLDHVGKMLCNRTIVVQRETYFDREVPGYKKHRTRDIPQLTCVCLGENHCNGGRSTSTSSLPLLVFGFVLVALLRDPRRRLY